MTDSLTRRRGSGWILAAAVVVVLLAYALRQADPDLWGHITYGKLWLTQGVVATDPYSYTSGGIPWIGHEIGAEILSYLAFTFGGALGLCVFKTAVGLLIAMIVWWALPKGLRRRWLGLLVWVAAMHIVSLYLLIRPQLFTYICTALCSLILFRNLRRPTRLVWLLPLICAFWTNFHGGYVVLLGLIVLYQLGPWMHHVLGRLRNREFARRTRPNATLLLVLLVAGLATFINPYGPKTWVCLFKALTNPYTKHVIDEWRGIQWLHPVRQEVLFMMMAGAVILSAGAGVNFRSLLRGDRPRRLDMTGLLVFFVTGLLAADSYRHIPLFAIIAAPWLVRWGSRAWRRMGRVHPSRARMFGPAVALAVLVPMVPTLWEIAADPYPRLRHMRPMPTGAVQHIQQNRLSGNIYCSFGWGQYLIAHLHPQCRVSMDGRYDTAYPKEEFVANFHFILEGDTDRAVQPPTDFVLTEAESAAQTSMSVRKDWRVIHSDDAATLWGRVGAAHEVPRYEIMAVHAALDPEYYP